MTQRNGTAPFDNHGTRNGAARHRRRHEPLCEPCKLAENAYFRGVYAAHPRPRRPRPQLQLERAAELADLGLLWSVPSRQLAIRLGCDPRTVVRYRARLRQAAA